MLCGRGLLVSWQLQSVLVADSTVLVLASAASSAVMSIYKPLSDSSEGEEVVFIGDRTSDSRYKVRVDLGVDESAHELQPMAIPSESEAEDGRDTKNLIPKEENRHEGTFVEYEPVLKIIGFGWFHIILLVVNGIALSSDAIEVLSISFVIPILKCRTEFSLTGWQDGLLSSIMFLGMLIGGYLWGGIADLTGRRRSLLMSLTLNGVFGLVSGLAPNIYFLLLFRFISGIGVGGSLPVIMPYTSEFVYSRYRGPYLSTLSVFWMIGGLLCGGAAWLLLPLKITGVSIGAITLHSWRVFLILSAIPSLLGALMYIVMPESPRFLLEVGKNKEALKILTLMFKLNHWRTKEVFPVQCIDLNLDHSDNWLLKAAHKRDGKFLTSIYLSIKEIGRKTLSLYHCSLVRPTLLLMVIFFCLSYGSYGVTLWYPTYVDQLNNRERMAEFNELCNQTVANRTLTETVLTELCPCMSTSYSNVVLNGVSLNSWPAANATIRDTVIANGHFTAMKFDSVLLHNVSIKNAVIEDSVFLQGNWTNIRILNTTFTRVTLCDVYTYDVVISDSIVDGEMVKDVLAQLTSGSECEEPDLLVNQTCVSDDSLTCGSNLFDDYQNSFFITASALPGNIVSAFALYYFWRSLWLGFVLGLSTISIFLLYVVNSKVVSVVILCLFNAISNPAWNACNVIITDIYATSVRTTATGMLLLMARIGAILGTYIFGQFSYEDPTLPIIMVAVVMAVGTIAALPLPKTTRRTALT